MMAASRMNTRKANSRVRFLNSASISAFLLCFIGEGVPVVTESVSRDGSNTVLSITALMDGLSLEDASEGRAGRRNLERADSGPARHETAACVSFQTGLPSALLISSQAAWIPADGA